MTQTYQTKYKTTLALPLAAADTSLEVATAPTVTKGRLLIGRGSTVEYVSFTGVSGTTVTGLTRGLSKTADPATAGTGSSWIAGTPVRLVAMHDQQIDKQQGDAALISATVYATTAARDSALGGDGAATKAYTNIYVTATGLHYNYNLSSNQWESVDAGTTTPNASTSAAGKVEMATTAESKAGTDTGGTGALTVVAPSDIAANQQSGTFVYAGASAAGNDTYAVGLTPALTAYTTGMSISFKTDVANTGACTINIDSLGAKSIKTIGGNDPSDGRLAAGAIINLVYDGTNMVLQDPPEKATQAQVTTATNDTTFVTPLGLKPDMITPTTRVGNTADGDVTYSHSLGRAPRKILFFGMTTSWTTIGGYVSGKNYSIRSTPGTDNDRCMMVTDGGGSYYAAVTAVSTTNFTLTRTKSSTPSTTLHFFASVE